MPLERGLIQDRRLAAVDPARMAHQNAGKAIGADDVHLASFHGEQDVGRAAIAADKLELRSGIFGERGRKQDRGGAAAGRADIVLFRAHVFERLDAGLWQRNAGVDVGHRAPDIRHFRHVDLAGVHQAVERERLGKTGKGRAVLGRHFVHVLCCDEAAGARHILRDDRRIARQVSRQKLGDEPAVDVVAAARPVADEHPQGLAAIEIRNRLCRRRLGR